MKIKILLFILTLIIVSVCWLVSFDSSNTLFVFGYKVVKLNQWLLTSISVAVCFWSMYFFHKNYEEMFITNDLLVGLLKLNTFASCFLASRYMFGGFHEDALLWILSFCVAFCVMYILHNLTVKGEHDKDDEDDPMPIAGTLSDL